MKKQYGFTLVEMAIVLVIVGLVLGGMFSGLSSMRETAKFKEDQQKLQDIKAALLSFAAINNRLPCPDSDNDGQENLNGNFCQQDYGALPFADLGTHASNAYGLAFSYQVNRQADTSDANDAANSASYFGVCAEGACFDKDTPPKSGTLGAGNFTIEDGSTNNLAIHIPILVLSHGQNSCNSVSGLENNNCSNSATTYYQAPQNRDSFDDVLIWLSSLEIKATTPEILTFNSGDSGNGPSPDWGDYTPTEDLSDTNLLDDAPSYGNLNGGTTQTITDSTGVFGEINSNAELELVGNTVVSTGNLNSNGRIILTGGNNIIQTNDLNSNGEIYEVNGANGNNTIRINGNMNSGAEISLNNGNNRVYVGGDINSGSTISFGSGTNILYVIGNINSNQPISIDGGTLYINSNIQTGKVNLLNGASVSYCNDPDMSCP
jgi:prepilin-type N-terminal cleavage/methylation domain-containing protein